jgi:hypothetical protein
MSHTNTIKDLRAYVVSNMSSFTCRAVVHLFWKPFCAFTVVVPSADRQRTTASKVARTSVEVPD